VKRTLWSLALVAVSVGTARATDPIVPAVEVRMKSIHEIISYGTYVGELVGQTDQFEQGTNLAKAFTNAKGLFGFDPKRPLGLYAGATKDVTDSPVVLLIPVIDEPTVLAVLKDQAKLTLKKTGDVYETSLPQFPKPFYFKFSDGYLHATIGAKENLVRALPPKAYFAAKADSLISLAVHVDRIPTDVKMVLLGQVEFQLQKEKERLKTDEPSASKRRIGGYALDATAALLKTVLDEAKTLAFAFTLDPKSDDVVTEFKVTPKTGTYLAEAIGTAGEKPSTTAGRVNGSNPMLAMNLNLALGEKWKEKLVPVVDDVLNAAEAGVDATFAEHFKKIIGSFEPTMKSGDYDLAIAMTGPDDAGKHKLHGFLKSKKMIDLVDALQDFFKILPASIIEGKFDSSNVNDSKIHAFSFHENPGDLERLFDSKTVYMGVKDDLLSFGFEPEAKGLKAALAATPKAKGVLRAEVAVARFAVMTAQGEKKPKVEKMVKGVFGDSTAGKDTIKLDVTAGNEVTVRLVAKGKALMALQGMDKINK
jgi:hypothetical protein